MKLFAPLIKSSIQNLPSFKKSQQNSFDHKPIYNLIKEYQKYLTFTGKTVAVRQEELTTKIKDLDLAHAKKALFTIGMNCTDMRHFGTQFSEVARFQANLERTSQSIKDIAIMLTKLNAALPPGEQLEPLKMNIDLSPTKVSGIASGNTGNVESGNSGDNNSGDSTPQDSNKCENNTNVIQEISNDQNKDNGVSATVNANADNTQSETNTTNTEITQEDSSSNR